MSELDERVVQMRFEGDNFEKGAERAIGILDRLKKSLSFSGASDGLSSIQKQSGLFSMDGISSAIDTVSSRFGIFEQFVAGVFLRLGSRAADFGTKLLNNVTLAPIKQGFSEYELQMRSIQTISANTGLSGSEGIAKINAALDELNEYADKTIYNFSEMTRNIGTFTAAGIDLDTSTKAIQGIANLAAVSGSTSQQASTAMYQLSQALASGTVKLQDWNSVVNAGMGGAVFQEALKRTARAHGIAVDEMIEKNGSFRESLKEGWITSDILTETLNQLAISYDEVGDEAYNAAKQKLLDANYSEKDAEEILELAKTAEEAATMVRTWTQLWETAGEALGSGWATTMRLIIGDFNQATEVFTWLSKKLTDIIDASSDARNAVLKDWGEKGGREALFGSIVNIVTALEKVLGSFSKAFSKVFGITADTLVDVSNKFGEFTEKLVLSDQSASDFTDDLTVLFEVFKGFLSVVGNIVSAMFNMANAIVTAGKKAFAFHRIVGIIQTVSDNLYKILSAIGEAFTDVFSIDESTIGDLSGIIGRALHIIEDFVKGLEVSDETVSKIKENFTSFFEILKNITGPLSDTFDRIYGFISGVSKSVKESGFIDSIVNAFSSIDLSGFFGKLKLAAGSALGIFGAYKGLSFFTKLREDFAEMIKSGNPITKVSEMFDKLKDAISSLQKVANVTTLLGIAGSIGLIAYSLKTISDIPSDKIASSLGLLAGGMAELMGSFYLFSVISRGIKPNNAAIGAMISMAIAINKLSKAMKTISEIGWEGIAKGLVSISVLLLAMTTSLNYMPDSGRILSCAAAMLVMSIAIGALSLSMKLLSTMSWEGIAKGLASIAGLLIEFVLAFNTMPDSGRILSCAAAMLIMSVAIGALSLSMKLLATMSWEDIAKGLASIAGLLIEFVIAFNTMPDSGRILSCAAAMLVMSIAIGALSLSMKLLSTMSWEGIAKGLASIAGLLVEVGIAMSQFQANIGGAAAMLIASVAIGALALSLKLLSGIPWEGIGKGLTAMGGALIGVGVALAVFQANIGGAAAMLIASIAMIALAGAINLLVPAMQALGNMSLAQIGTALLAIGGAFLVLGGTAALISALAAPTLAFSASMLLLAAALYIAAQGIAVLIAALTPVLPAMIEAGENIVNGIVQGVSGMLSALGTLAKSIFDSLVGAVKSLFGINSPSTVMAEIGENTIQGLIEGIGGLLGSLGEKAGEIVTSIVGGLTSLPSKVLELGGSAVSGLGEKIGSAVGSIGGKATELGSGILSGLGGIVGGMKDKATSGVNSLVSGFSSRMGSVKSAGTNIVNNVKNALTPLSSAMKSKATDSANAFSSALSSGAGRAKSAASTLISGAKSGLSSLYSSFHSTGSSGASGLAAGLTSGTAWVRDAARRVAQAAIDAAKATLDSHSPSKVFIALGEFSGEGLALGFASQTGNVSDSASSLADTLISSFSGSLHGMSVNVEDILDTDYNPVITPVIDGTQFDYDLASLSNRISSSMLGVDVNAMNYNEMLSGKLDSLITSNDRTAAAVSNTAIDYDRLGVSIANALIQSGVHVEMDGGQLMGYLAGEIQGVRRMYG